MTEEFFARAALFLTQTGIALLLSYLLWTLSRTYQQDYIRNWLVALVAFAVYQITILLQFTAVQPASIQTFLRLTSVASSYVFAVFLLRGMLLVRDSHVRLFTHAAPAKVFLIIIVCGAITTLPFDLKPELQSWQNYFMIQVRLVVIGGLLLTAAVSLLHRAEQTLGQRLAVVVLFLWGALYIGYALWMMLSSTLVSNEQVRLIYKCLELFSLCSLGLAMLIWLHEQERNTNRQLTEKTRYLNRYDQLTGALNRDALLALLQEKLQQHSETPLYLLMLGLDKFKTINESVGLKQGDTVLQLLNQRFESSILKPAIVARTGGDIFALVLTDINSDSQLQFALRHVQQLVSKRFDLVTGPLQLTCTIGVARSPDDAITAETLLQKANIAFHQAKRLQSHCLAYAFGMEEESARLISWESDILDAMQNDEFELYFQPQVNLHDNKLEAFEVLVRWQHPKKGFLMPGQFLPFVEQLGLSRQLDFWVLQKSVQTISRWRKQQISVPLAVNMSPLHFQQDGLKQKIQQLLLLHKVSPELLELEITENTAMHDMEKGSNHVLEMQQMGIRVSIDDFGTGYSSLAYLRRMPIDKIKIDRSFVMDMAGNDSDMMIVKTMIKLAHGLGKRILAEGVETPVQLKLLKGMSCDAVQGYLVAKPLSEVDALVFATEKLSL